MKKITVLTGAGISTESGINTFRATDGLWEGHDVMEVASPIGWRNNPELVLEFYNKRRRQLLEVSPNDAHRALAALEKKYEVTIITQNVDDLHERAGSQHVIHLHGELFKIRSQADPSLVLDWKTDLNWGDHCPQNSQFRPHIVWFGEDVPLMDTAIPLIQDADIVMIIGTSMQVYPAAGLLTYAPNMIPVYFVDPNPAIVPRKGLTIIAEKATIGLTRLVNQLLNS